MPNPVSLILYPIPLPAVPVIPVEVHSLPHIWVASDWWPMVSATLAAMLVSAVIYHIKQQQKGKDNADEWPGRNQESVTAALRRLKVSSRGERSVGVRDNGACDQQLHVPSSQQQLGQRRVNGRRYEEDSIPYRPRHPRGSTFESWARHLQTKGKK